MRATHTSGTVTELRPGTAAAGARPGELPAAASADLDQAELFLLSLERESLGGELRAAYLLGLAEAHLANLVEVLRQVTR